MNRKLRKMIKEIERRGGIIQVNENLPEAMAEQFLETILCCPDCGAAHSGRRDFDPDEMTIDKVLGGTEIPRRFGGH